MKIVVGDIVLHTLSGLYYKCENNKHQRWMNENPYYELQDKNVVPPTYFHNIANRH